MTTLILSPMIIAMLRSRKHFAFNYPTILVENKTIYLYGICFSYIIGIFPSLTHFDTVNVVELVYAIILPVLIICFFIIIDCFFNKNPNVKKIVKNFIKILLYGLLIWTILMQIYFYICNFII